MFLNGFSTKNINKELLDENNFAKNKTNKNKDYVDMVINNTKYFFDRVTDNEDTGNTENTEIEKQNCKRNVGRLQKI